MTSATADTTRKQAAVICLLVLAAVALYFCYLIAKPFLGPVVIAVMLAIVFYPVHARMEQSFQRPSLAAALSTISVLLLVVIPMVLLAVSVSGELRAVAQSLRDQSGPHGGWSPYLAQWIESLTRRLGNYVDSRSSTLGQNCCGGRRKQAVTCFLSARPP